MKRLCLGFIFLAASAVSASAHEWWLEPQDYAVATGEVVGIAHKNGMRFKGNQYPYVGAWHVKLEAWQNGVKAALKGTDGDRPAINLKSGQEGLITLVYEGKPDRINFTSWEKFTAYLAEEGLSHLVADHKAAGYPEKDIKEVYTRFAKTLVNVGEAKGQDQATGLKFELVAQANPASLKPGEPMRVRLLLEGKPVPDAPIKIFSGYDTEPNGFVVTDGRGYAAIPYSGAGPYLVNSVHLFRPEPTEEEPRKGAHWESYWASLTYSRGG